MTDDEVIFIGNIRSDRKSSSHIEKKNEPEVTVFTNPETF